MKIVICTTPIRPVPTNYPPLGSLAVIQALRKAGYDPIFFDIDCTRPSFEQVVARFKAEAPDVIGISAVVSTAYAYAKKLCTAIRAVLPSVKIVLGGNLAASAELLHRFCKVDVCVIGEGERVIVNLVKYYAQHRGADDCAELKAVKGISFLDADGNMVFTGYEAAIPADDLFDPDYSILEQYSKVDTFISDPMSRDDFARDPRTREAHREGKKLATVVFTKGCVARCTFCHRWDKGFRQFSPEKVLRQIRYLMDRYNVGFIQFGDENFGSDRKATDELIRLLKPLDILWGVAGVRARSIDLEQLQRMRDAGCVALYFGFETGSAKMLKIMEKKLELTHALNAARATYEAGLYTIYQLVIGMPGEDEQTIAETVDLVKQVTEFLPDPPDTRLSINYIQALPGTAVYEYARGKGLIGPRLEDEEEYLISISDVNAADDAKCLNFTASPHLVVRSWRARILLEATQNWHKHRRSHEGRRRVATKGVGLSYDTGGYFNRRKLLLTPGVLELLRPIPWLPVWAWTVYTEYRRSAPATFFQRVRELATWRLEEHPAFDESRSLRQVMRDSAPSTPTPSAEAMVPLRLGR